MTLSYRSSIPEQRYVVERHADGRERIAKAIRQPGENFWDCTIVHPSGQQWHQRFHGHADNVAAAMSNWLASKKQEFLHDKINGDRRPAVLDTNVRVAPSDPDYFLKR